MGQGWEEGKCTQVLFTDKGSDGGGRGRGGLGLKMMILFQHVESRCLVDVR